MSKVTSKPPGYLIKLKSNVWKCYQIRKQQYILILVNVLLPVIPFGIVAGTRAHIGELHEETTNTTIYNPIFSQEYLYTHFKPDIDSTVIYYSPATNFTNELIRRVQLEFQIPNHAIQNYENEDELVHHYLQTKPQVCFAIIFEGLEDDAIPSQLSYTIRTNDANIRRFRNQFYQENGKYIQESGSTQYFQSSFMGLQMMIDTSFIRMQRAVNLTLNVQEFPYPPHKEPSEIKLTILNSLSAATLIGFILIYPMLMHNIVDEKYSGIKELLKIIGLPTSVMWMCWFIEALVLSIASLILMVLCMELNFSADTRVLEFCDPFILGLFLLLYWSASIALCFLIATVVNNPIFTSISAIIICIATYFIAWVHADFVKTLPFGISMLFCIFPNFAMYNGYRIISGYETRDIGLSWETISKPYTDRQNELAMIHIFVMLAIDTFVFMVLTIYIDSINPGKMGSSKPYYYPFSYIKKMLTKEKKKYTDNLVIRIEPIRTSQPIVRIRDLCKNYDRPVLNRLSIDFSEGEITAMLGHNGAGKTTTLSILSGMISPTSGSVIIHDNENDISYDVVEDLDCVRSLIGFCPQQNLLLRDLSVFNHMKFVAMMNGVENADEEILDLLALLQLIEVKHKTPEQLSGGMNRKLCLGMALIKNPMVLILDEPTSSLDPVSRREIWNILNRIKTHDHFKRCSIILSTHLMDEAEILGDMIAIIDHGTCIANDTQENLKIKYNTGINLTVVNDRGNAVEAAIRGIYGGLSGKTCNGNERLMSYKLPKDSEKLYKVVETCEKLKENMSIEDFMITNTSIDDVFSNINERFDHSITDLPVASTESMFKQHGATDQYKRNSIWRIMWIMFLAHLSFTMKIKWKLFYAVGFCVLAAGFILFLTTPKYISNTYNSSMPLDLIRYGNTRVYYSRGNTSEITKLAATFKNVTSEKFSDAVLVDSVSNALLQDGLSNIDNYNQNAVIAAEFNETSNGIAINAMYSNAALHGAPMSWNVVANTIGRAYLGNEFSIKVQSKDMPTSANSHIPLGLSALWILFLFYIVPILTTQFMIYSHMQRKSNLLQLLSMTGAREWIYWITLMISNLIVYFIMAASVILLLLLSPIYSGTTEICTFAILLMLYGLVTVPWIYVLSLWGTITSALTWSLASKVLSTCMFLLIELSKHVESTEFCRELLKWTFCLNPENAVAFMIYKFGEKAIWNYNWISLEKRNKAFLCKLQPDPCCDESNFAECRSFQAYLTFIQQRCYLAFPILASCLILTLFIACVKSMRKPARDETDMADNVYQIRDLSKNFKKTKAVDNLSADVRVGSCIGLLGTNGSGKTTTFRLLSGSIRLESGNASIDKKSLKYDTREYLLNFGYCPQVDAQEGTFTVKEMLQLFGNLHGYDDVNQIVDYLLDSLDLSKYADVPCEQCSGGTRRKLSIGMSLIVNPKVILLDEPSCGLDPLSRKHLWNFLFDLKRYKTIVLSTHSLQECEVVCDSVLILCKGKVLINNTPVFKLKKEYGDIYIVEIRLNNNRDCDEIVSKFEHMFEQQKGFLEKKQTCYLKFSVSAKSKLLDILKMLEEFKKRNVSNVKDYTVSVPSLEHIFMHIINLEYNIFKK